MGMELSVAMHINLHAMHGCLWVLPEVWQEGVAKRPLT